MTSFSALLTLLDVVVKLFLQNKPAHIPTYRNLSTQIPSLFTPSQGSTYPNAFPVKNGGQPLYPPDGACSKCGSTPGYGGAASNAGVKREYCNAAHWRVTGMGLGV